MRPSARIAGLVIGVAALVACASPAGAVAATLNLSPAAGPAGATVGAGGTGFGSACGARLEWETVDGQFVATLGQAEVGGGAFSTEFVVPEQRALGAHVVRAKGLAIDAAGRCSVPAGPVATAVFSVEAAPPPPVASLALNTATVNPGGLLKLDASGSSGAIKLFQFDLDGNGSFETKCGSAAAGVVNTSAGQKQVGVQVVGPAGAKDTITLAVNIAGGPAAPPPKPSGGGSFAPIGSGSSAGTCAEPSQSVSDLLYETYACPGMVSTGVATAFIPQDLPGDPCFERIENSLLTHWRAQSGVVLFNGLRLDTLGDHLRIYDLLKKVNVDGGGDARFKVSKPGFDTAVNSGVFEPKWDVSKPGTVGVVPVQQLFGFGSFLGLPYAAKDTPLRLTGSAGASFDLFLQLPLPQLLFKSNASSSALTVRVNATDGVEIDSAYTLKVNDVNAGVFALKDMTVSYQRQGGSDFWGGGLTLLFPASSVAASGSIGVRDGVLEKLEASITPGPPGVPVGCCVYLVEFGGQLSANSITAHVVFAAGPEVLGNTRAAEATGTATVYYEPFELLLTADNLKVVNRPLSAKGQVIITLDSFAASGQLNQDFGPFSVNAGVGASVGNGHWGVSGSGDGCIDVIIDACVGVKVAAGPSGVAGCGKVSVPIFPDPAGGAVVYWSGGFGTFWGCSMGKIKGKAGASATAAARAADPRAGTAAKPFRVRVPRGLGRGLFAIAGNGGAPQVRLKGPGLPAITTPPPGQSTSRGARWFATRATPDGTTYVLVFRPPAGRWKVSQLPGSPSIRSIGFARGLPGKLTRGRVRGKGRSRTLQYRLEKVPGTRVTFVERGGPATPTGPGQTVDQTIGVARRARGQINFRPAEALTRARRIEAVVESGGVAVRTETVARFRAPKFSRLPPPKVSVTRKGSSLLVRWSRIRAAQRYRAVVDLSDDATRSFETSPKRRGLRIAGIGALSSGLVEVRALSPGGYLGKGGFGRLRRIPALRVDRSLTASQVLRAKGVAARCTASADGVCALELRRGGKLLATGARTLAFSQVTRVLARLTKAGRKALTGRGAVRATLTADVPGQTTAPVKVRIASRGGRRK